MEPLKCLINKLNVETITETNLNNYKTYTR